MIKVIYTDIAAVSDAMQSALLSLASPHRRARALRYAKREDRIRCLVVEYLMRKLYERMGYDPADFALAAKENGMPYLLHNPDLFVSASHAGRYVTVAIADAPIGIDVETLPTRIDLEALAKHYYTEHERRVPEQLRQDEKDRHLLSVWTGKESYRKRYGCALPGGLSSFSVDVAGGRAFTDDGVDPSSLLSFFTVAPDTVLCVCASERIVSVGFLALDSV